MGAGGMYEPIRIATPRVTSERLRAQVADAARYIVDNVDRLIPDDDEVYVLEDGLDVTIHTSYAALTTVEVRAQYVPKTKTGTGK